MNVIYIYLIFAGLKAVCMSTVFCQRTQAAQVSPYAAPSHSKTIEISSLTFTDPVSRNSCIVYHMFKSPVGHTHARAIELFSAHVRRRYITVRLTKFLFSRSLNVASGQIPTKQTSIIHTCYQDISGSEMPSVLMARNTTCPVSL